MRSLILGAIAVTFLIGQPVEAANGWNSRTGRGATSCSEMEFSHGSYEVVKGEETLRIGGRSLAIEPARNMGVSVRGGSGGDYQVTLCKGVRSGLDLSSVRLVERRGRLTVEGPSGESWHGYILVEAPAGAQLEVEVHNGPLSLADLDGSFTARANNGPVSAKNVKGILNVNASNGPISFTGSSGDVKLNAKNGPISLRLDGYAWTGGSLEAETQNGPVSLRVREGFGSGVVVEGMRRAPLSCDEAICGQRIRSIGENDRQPRPIELGSGMQAVRVTTTNGPISIKALTD